VDSLEENVMKTALGIVLAAGLASVANAQVFTSGGPTSIPDNDPAGVNIPINVSGAVANITDITVTLRFGTTGIAPNREHTWVGDIIATITSPGGATFELMRRTGSTTPTGVGNLNDANGAYSFNDNAANALFWPNGTPAGFSAGWTAVAGNVPNGTYRPARWDGSAVVATSLMGAFGGQNANGVWTLNISDNASLDQGDLINWEINVVPAPGSVALLGLAGLAAGRRRR
jgi:subtilisin-like proprotein convertase family protein